MARTKTRIEKKKQPEKEKTGPDYMSYLPLLATVIIFFIIYNQVLTFELTDWDDYGYIKTNPDIQNFAISKFFTNFYMGNYHPLTCISLAIDYNFWQLNGKGYHLTNILFHAMNICLVFFFIKKLTERKDIAWFAAILFAVHPMHVESVAWVAERKDVIYGFFFLFSLIAYLQYIKTNKMMLYVASLLLFILSLLSKPAAIILPIVLLLLDYFKNVQFNFRNILLKIPFFIISFCFGLVALRSQQVAMQTVFAPHFPFLQRIFIASYGFTYYILSLFYPFSQSPLHPYPVTPSDPLPLYIYLSGIVIIALILLIILVKRHQRVLIFGTVFFIINLLMVIQIIPVGQAIVAERYTYLPYLGLYIILGYLLFSMKPKTRNSLILVVSLWIIVLCFKTYYRLPVWKNSETLFSDIIEKYPKEPNAYYNRGLYKYNSGRFREAGEDYLKAIEVKPDYTLAYFNLSLVSMQLQDYKGVLEQLNKAISIEPDYIDAHKNRGIARAILKDYPGALNDFEFVLQKFPNDTSALLNRGITYINLNKLNQACEDFSRASHAGCNGAIALSSKYCGK